MKLCPGESRVEGGKARLQQPRSPAILSTLVFESLESLEGERIETSKQTRRGERVDLPGEGLKKMIERSRCLW